MLRCKVTILYYFNSCDFHCWSNEKTQLLNPDCYGHLWLELMGLFCWATATALSKWDFNGRVFLNLEKKKVLWWLLKTNSDADALLKSLLEFGARLYCLLIEMETHPFPSSVEGTQACACPEPVQGAGSLTTLHAGGNMGRTDKRAMGKLLLLLQLCRKWSTAVAETDTALPLLSHPSGEPVHHISMKKPLALHFQQSSRTEGKATEPNANTEVCGPPKIHLNSRELQPGWNQKFRRFFFPRGEDLLL